MDLVCEAPKVADLQRAVCYFFSSVLLQIIFFPRHLQTFIFPAHSIMAMCHRNNFKVPLNVNTNKFQFSWFIPERESSRRDGQGRSLLNAKLNTLVDTCIFGHACFYVNGLFILLDFQYLNVRILASTPKILQLFLNFSISFQLHSAIWSCLPFTVDDIKLAYMCRV